METDTIRTGFSSVDMVTGGLKPSEVMVIAGRGRTGKTTLAQNALLKTIEEPPAYAVILLLTTNADSFLQTILSRCITLNMKTVKAEVSRVGL